MFNQIKQFFTRIFSQASSDNVISLPFTIAKHSESYIRALFEVLFNEESSASIKKYAHYVDIEFGTEDTSHILHFGVLDVSVFMQPTANGWTAERVYIDRVEPDNDQVTGFENMEFLFQYPIPMRDQKPLYIFDGLEIKWRQLAKVYAPIGG